MTNRTQAAPPIDDRPLSELLSDMSDGVKRLVDQELQLAKREVKEQASKGARAGAMFSASAVAALFALLMVSFAAAWGLAALIPAGLAFLAVGVVYVFVAAVLYGQARKGLADFRPVPEQTVRTLKDDVEVAASSFSRGVNAVPYSRPWGQS